MKEITMPKIKAIIWFLLKVEEKILILAKTLLKHINPIYEPKIPARSRFPGISPR